MDFTDPIQSIALVVTVLASVWAAQSAITSGWQYANSLRDAVIMGKLQGVAITAEHARLIRDNDYRSAFIGLVMSSFAFSILLIYIGAFALANGVDFGSWNFRIVGGWQFAAVGVIGLVVGFMHLFRAIGTVTFYGSEHRVMTKAIEARETAT
ncbi:hypothetical protein [Devosia sp. LjRoot3]|uniref:hypothetical protein n=1 Tax=Devosia sp. LjRoot3 TaxID=3342319 RepID=UPI003ED07763